MPGGQIEEALDIEAVKGAVRHFLRLADVLPCVGKLRELPRRAAELRQVERFRPELCTGSHEHERIGRGSSLEGAQRPAIVREFASQHLPRPAPTRDSDRRARGRRSTASDRRRTSTRAGCGASRSHTPAFSRYARRRWRRRRCRCPGGLRTSSPSSRCREARSIFRPATTPAWTRPSGSSTVAAPFPTPHRQAIRRRPSSPPCSRCRRSVCCRATTRG